MTLSEPAAGRSIVVGTAGHIDHGKTALVHALTGINTDRLPEEKRRGITVDIGFARLSVTSSSGDPLSLEIIDVPGHKQFVRNMLAGAGGIDMVLLVISAAEGVMPQTEEHLAICGLLGIERGVVVLSKADLVSNDQLEATCKHVRERFWSSFLKDAPMVAVSAQAGSGISELRAIITRLAEAIPIRREEGVPRLPIDRAFVMRGFGTVVTGTLRSGRLETGQGLVIEPGGKTVRIRGLQRHGLSQANADAGSRVALNLSGVEVTEVRRGDTLVVPSTIHAVDTIDAEILLLPGAEVQHRDRVRLHSGTSETIAKVSIYGYSAVGQGETRIVRLTLSKPVVLLPGDRFVLRRLSPAQTVGGGRVIDAHPAARTPKKKALSWLKQIKDASMVNRMLLRVERRESNGILLHQLAREMGWRDETIRQAVRPALETGALRLINDKLLMSDSAWQGAAQQILDVLPRVSAGGAPAGVRQGELRSRSNLPAEVFIAELEDLSRLGRILLHGEPGNAMVYPAGTVLDAQDPNAVRIEEMATLYLRSKLNPPGFLEVIRELQLSEKEARAYATILLRNKTLVKLTPDDLFIHRQATEDLQNMVRGLKGQTLDVGRLKQITGLSRKYAIPLLEYLDRQQITRRQGTTRIIL